MKDKFIGILSIEDVIRKKRDGFELSNEEIDFFVNRVAAKKIGEAQIGAWLMACFLRGLSEQETTSLALSMTHSGTIMSWPIEWNGKVVDKHSTGGVGDKISLILAPVLAALGAKVPMISGRGLSHTGGTLDKMEAIPGFSVSSDDNVMMKYLHQSGCCIVGQSGDLAPADKDLYRCRDVTSTVDYDPLIVGSILSKKAAEGLDVLLLDVKVGQGAFRKTLKDAELLAERLVSTSTLMGIRTVAYLTDMNSPIGRSIGNALEVEESIECLRGGGPEDTNELVRVFGGKILHLIGLAEDSKEGEDKVDQSLSDGSALRVFYNMLVNQGVDTHQAKQLCYHDVWSVMKKAPLKTEFKTEQKGYVQDIHSYPLARVCQLLGGGRTVPGEPLDHSVGLEVLCHVGEEVDQSQPWIVVHHSKPLDRVVQDMITSSLVITDCEVTKRQMVLKIVE